MPRTITSRLLSEFEPDVLVVQFSIASQGTTILPTLKLMRTAYRSGVPVVAAFHEPNREINRLGPISRWIYRTAARCTTHPVAYSLAGVSALLHANIFTDVQEVPLGCASTNHHSTEEFTRVRDKYGITAPLVLSMGFTHPDKGSDLLVESMTEVTRLLNGDVQFLVAGSPRIRRGIFRLMGRVDRNFHNSLVTKMENLSGVSIRNCDFVPDEDVFGLLRLASAVVLPYRRATQSGIANLALSAEAVIVASDIQGLRSDLGPAARYFRSEDVGDLTKILTSVLRNSQDELRITAGKRAADRSYDTTAATLLHLGLNGPTHLE
jgi:glycosyltransferase involved in cell wall biosynthesis